MPIVLDDSAWPVLYHTLGDHTVDHFNVFAAWYLGCLQRAHGSRTPLVVVSDVRGVVAPPEVRRHAALWMAQLSSQQRELCALSVIVLDSPIVRAAITALNWFQRPVTPQHVVSDLPGAWDHVDNCLQQRLQPVPARPAWCTF
jgi:hypothetical protein